MPLLTAKHARMARGPGDGLRLLVTRFWPRGVRRAEFDLWLPALAPSKALLGDFRATLALNPGSGASDPWPGFCRRYRAEMRGQAELIADLRRRYRGGDTITLLCACHDPARCHRSLLAGLIRYGWR